MKVFRLLLVAVVLFCGLHLSAQSVLPPLKQNSAAKPLIEAELSKLKQAYQSTPTTEILSKIDLFTLALGFLNEPTQIPPTTDYALTSAFLNHDVNFNKAEDSEAMVHFYHKVWQKEFEDLVNLVKQ